LIDLHSHILPGIDDGARTFEESHLMALEAEREGIDTIVATPHVRYDYPTTPATVSRVAEELRSGLARSGTRVQLITGAEVSLEHCAMLSPAELAAFTIAQNGRYLLLETPYAGWPLALDQELTRLSEHGLVPILAHPERNPSIQENPDRLRAAVAAGAIAQITAASVDGRLGRRTQQTALRLLDLGLVHVLASDSHTPEIRRGGLLRALEVLNDPDLARRLTSETPESILAGDNVRPPVARMSGARRFFRFR
jgi:protein-tyrosine phosphatase